MSDWPNSGPLTIFLGPLDQGLSYGEILAGRPEAWLVKQIVLMHAITKFQKGPHIEIQNNFHNMFRFYDIFNGI